MVRKRMPRIAGERTAGRKKMVLKSYLLVDDVLTGEELEELNT